jgi:endonuclease III
MNYLVDPVNITKYDCSDNELELLILFWICAAGKNAITTSNCLNKFFIFLHERYKDDSPFELLKKADKELELWSCLKDFGIGCYTKKAEFFKDLIYSSINLKTCSVKDLEFIKGIGPKTARCFLIHSRENQNYAGLDVHVLSFLRDNGHDVPKNTPTGKKYEILENIFLEYVKKSKKTAAEFDLDVWRKYSGRKTA